MKKGIWLIVPLLLVGASACSGNSPSSTGSEALPSGLEGVEFIVHQAPG